MHCTWVVITSTDLPCSFCQCRLPRSQVGLPHGSVSRASSAGVSGTVSVCPVQLQTPTPAAGQGVPGGGGGRVLGALLNSHAPIPKWGVRTPFYHSPQMGGNGGKWAEMGEMMRGSTEIKIIFQAPLVPKSVVPHC